MCVEPDVVLLTLGHDVAAEGGRLLRGHAEMDNESVLVSEGYPNLKKPSRPLRIKPLDMAPKQKLEWVRQPVEWTYESALAIIGMMATLVEMACMNLMSMNLRRWAAMKYRHTST
jgi:hypothetical protein